MRCCWARRSVKSESNNNPKRCTAYLISSVCQVLWLAPQEYNGLKLKHFKPAVFQPGLILIPQGTLAMETFLVVTTEGCTTTGIWWVEAKNATKHSIIRSVGPHNIRPKCQQSRVGETLEAKEPGASLQFPTKQITHTTILLSSNEVNPRADLNVCNHCWLLLCLKF